MLSSRLVRLLGAVSLVVSLGASMAPAALVASAALASGPNLSTSTISSNPLGTVNPDSTITYTATINNTGEADAKNVKLTSTADGNSTMVSGSERESPVAVDDTYPNTVVGNVSIDSSKISYSATANDLLPAGTTLSAFDSTSANGGTVSMTTSGAGMGQFTYNPPAGFDGTDTFTYTLTNSLGSSVGTVSLTVGGMIWFIDKSAGACASQCGRLTNPFNSIGGFQAVNDGSGTHPAKNQTIFVYFNAASYSGNLRLLSGQKLVGSGASSSLATLAGVTPGSDSATLPSTGGSNPTIQSSGGTTLALADGNTLDGVSLLATSGAALTGSNYGTFTAADSSVEADSGTAVSLTTGNSQATFASVTSASAASGIAVTNSKGSFTSGGGTIGSTNSALGITGDGAKFTGQSTSQELQVSLSGMSFTNANTTVNSTCKYFDKNADANTNLNCNAAIYLQNVSSAALSSVVINGAAQNCVNGNYVSNFAFTNSTAKSCGTTPSAADLESGIFFVNLLGTSSIAGSTIGTSGNQNAQWDLKVQNNLSSGSLDSLKVSGGTTFGPNKQEQGVNYSGQGSANMEIDIEGGSITGTYGAGFFSVGQDTSSIQDIVKGVSITQSGGEGIDIAGAGSGNIKFDVENNTVTSSTNAVGIEHGTGILVDMAGQSPDTEVIQGKINNNNVGTLGTPYSGGGDGSDGIWVDANGVTNGASQLTVAITNNHIYQVGNDGIDLTTGYGNQMAATVKGNTVVTEQANNESQNSYDGLFIESSKRSADTSTFCGDIGGSGADANSLNGIVNDIEVDDRSWHRPFNLVGLGSSAVSTFLSSRNTLANGTVAVDNNGSGQAYASAGSCVTPSTPNPLATIHPRRAESRRQAVAATHQTGHMALRVARGRVRRYVITGNTLTATLGTLNPEKSVIVQWQVTVNGHINNPAGATSITGAATVSADSLADTPLSTSNPLALFDSTTAVAADVNPVQYGNTVTFTATVAAATGTGTPEGSVEFDVDGNFAGSSTLVSGQATFATSTLAAGSRVITAKYSGSDRFNGSSGDLQGKETVNPAATGTVIKADNNPSNYGGSITFTATVTNTDSSATPAGAVEFFDGATDLGPGTALSGSTDSATSTFTTTQLGVGGHTITAKFTDSNGNFADSQDSVSQSVNQADSNTTLKLTSGSNPSFQGDSLTFTATVSAKGTAGPLDPSGTVKFYDGDPNSGGTQIGSDQTLSGGTASVTVNDLSVGDHSIFAVYQGDANYNGSQNSLDQEVQADTTTTTMKLTSGSNPSTYGDTLTFTASVTSNQTSTNTIGGSVAFWDGDPSAGGTELGTVAVDSGGQAAFSTDGLTGGDHTIYAVYSGDSNFAGSQTSIGQHVDQAGSATTISLTGGANPSKQGDLLTFTAVVSASGTAGPQDPSGTVKFYDGDPSSGGTQIGSDQTLQSGSASVTTSSLSVGDHNVFAVYQGDANYLGSQDSISQHIDVGNVDTGTSITLTTGSNPSTYGDTLVWTATITPSQSSSNTPSGSVAFWDGDPSAGGTLLGSSPVDNSSQATFSTAGLTGGAHTIFAVYGGDANFKGSQGSVDQQVDKGATTTGISLTAGANPSAWDDPLTFTAMVSASRLNVSPPTGSVRFYNDSQVPSHLLATDGLTDASTASQSKGSATLSLANLGPGVHTVLAVYGSDSNYAGSQNSTGQTVLYAIVKFRQNLGPFSSPVEAPAGVDGIVVTTQFRSQAVCRPNGLVHPAFNVKWTVHSSGVGQTHNAPCDRRTGRLVNRVDLRWTTASKISTGKWTLNGTAFKPIPGLTAQSDGAQIHACLKRFSTCLQTDQSLIGQVWWTKNGQPFQQITPPAGSNRAILFLSANPPGNPLPRNRHQSRRSL